jgi:hypothetical protein
MTGPGTRRKVGRGSRCGAWARSRKHVCRGWAMPNGRCRHHGGKSTGPRTPEGKAKVGAASAREWRAWRAERGLPADWRWVDSRRRGGRQTAAQWLAEHGPEGEQS